MLVVICYMLVVLSIKKKKKNYVKIRKYLILLEKNSLYILYIYIFLRERKLFKYKRKNKPFKISNLRGEF